MSDAADHDPQPPAPGDPVSQVRAVVAACIEAMERGERDPVSRLCAGQPDLAERVQRRLQQLAGRGLLPTDSMPTQLAPVMPASIGAYRIVRELGGGGMGTVYLAEQSQPVQRQVALKVIRQGMDTLEVVARFQGERQALASMSHPHIAQVFDAGVTPEGRPYFVMEYVDGTAITHSCDAQRLSTRARLRLFATVCRAVQHAHDKGIIHRDLKPSNVLVARAGDAFVPKVIDFGIAKLTAPGPDAPQHTRSDQVLGTPEYMSPEQACSGGIDVDTRTDVYSLGVLLYELLCGSLPFESHRLRNGSRRELERILLEEAPTSPSTRLQHCQQAVAAARGAEPAALSRQVRGELDWIVLRALRKEREGRYPSPLALCEDIERHLAHEPVQAGPPGLGYRLRKLVRRHRVEAAAAAAVLLSLLAGLWISIDFYLRERTALRQMTEARQREGRAHADTADFYQLARGAVEQMLVQVGDTRLRQVPQADAVRRQLLEDALQFYDNLRQRQPTDPGLQLESAYAQERTGAIYHDLGRLQDAEAQFRGALAQVETLLQTAPDHDSCLRLRATIRGNLGALLANSGRPQEGTALQRQAIADLDAIAAPDQRTPGDAAIAAGLLNNLALEQDDAPQTAVSLFDAAIAQLQRAAAAGPAGELQVKLALCHCNRARALDRLGDADGAAAALRAAIAQLQQLAEASADLEARQKLAFAHDQLADLLARHQRTAAAMSEQEQANAMLQGLAAEHPEIVELADGLAGGLHRLADLFDAGGDATRAIATYRESIAVRERVVREHPQYAHGSMRLARSWLNLGGVLAAKARRESGDLDPAAAAYRTAFELAGKLHRQAPEDSTIAVTYAVILSAQAALLDLQQRYADAEAAYAEARAALEACLRGAPGNAELHRHLAVLLGNLAVTQFRREDMAGMAATAESGLEQVREGLRLDAADAQLRQQLVPLVARLAHARRELGDVEGSLQATAVLVEDPLADAAARELGSLVLTTGVLDLTDAVLRTRWLPRAEQALRSALDRHDDGAAPLAPEAIGKDVELCCALVDVLTAGGDPLAERTRWLRRAEAELAGCELPRERLTNLLGQVSQTWLQTGDAAAAARCARAMAQRLPDVAEAQRGAAGLLARCAQQGGDEAESWAAAAVACLRAAVDLGKLTPEQVRGDAAFASLRQRADFRALVKGTGR